jgi:hypothetical protein
MDGTEAFWSRQNFQIPSNGGRLFFVNIKGLIEGNLPAAMELVHQENVDGCYCCFNVCVQRINFD